MLTMRMRYSILLCALALAVPAAWAQEKDPRVNPPVAPIPPVTSGESSSKAPTEASGVPAPKPATPDSRPLSGAEALTLGSSGGSPSLLKGNVSFSQSVDTNAGSAAGQSALNAVSTLSARLNVERSWDSNQLRFDYASGGNLYNKRSQYNSMVHQFSFSQTFNLRRWTLLLSDQLSYLPDSSGGNLFFGGSSLGGYGNSFASPTFGNLNPTYLPNQSIFTSQGDRISNSVVGQAQYNFNRGSSITVTGSYGILRFVEGGFINSKNASFHTGYNLKLNRHDTLAVTYRFGRHRFEGFDQGANNHMFHFVYARRMTGRMALQLAGGPQVNVFKNPLTGSDTRVAWSFGSTLLYDFRHSNLNLSYGRSMTGGSGVLLGAYSDQVQAILGRQLSRNWSASLGGGYAHNRSIRELTAGTVERTFNTWHADVSLRRPVGRSLNLSFYYRFHWQSTQVAPCVGTCVPNLSRHHFGIGFDWHFRPIALD